MGWKSEGKEVIRVKYSHYCSLVLDHEVQPVPFHVYSNIWRMSKEEILQFTIRYWFR